MLQEEQSPSVGMEGTNPMQGDPLPGGGGLVAGNPLYSKRLSEVLFCVALAEKILRTFRQGSRKIFGVSYDKANNPIRSDWIRYARNLIYNNVISLKPIKSFVLIWLWFLERNACRMTPMRRASRSPTETQVFAKFRSPKNHSRWGGILTRVAACA